MNRLEYILLIVALIFTACASTVKVYHSIRYDKKGSRSERRNGELRINGFKMPYTFKEIYVNDTAFVLITKTHFFGNHGYFAVKGGAAPEVSADKIKSSALKKGFYKGSARLTNTPESWFYVKWEDGDAFVDGERIESILKGEPFSTLPNLLHLAERPVMKN